MRATAPHGAESMARGGEMVRTSADGCGGGGGGDDGSGKGRRPRFAPLTPLTGDMLRAAERQYKYATQTEATCCAPSRGRLLLAVVALVEGRQRHEARRLRRLLVRIRPPAALGARVRRRRVAQTVAHLRKNVPRAVRKRKCWKKRGTCTAAQHARTRRGATTNSTNAQMIPPERAVFASPQ